MHTGNISYCNLFMEVVLKRKEYIKLQLVDMIFHRKKCSKAAIYLHRALQWAYIDTGKLTPI